MLIDLGRVRRLIADPLPLHDVPSEWSHDTCLRLPKRLWLLDAPSRLLDHQVAFDKCLCPAISTILNMDKPAFSRIVPWELSSGVLTCQSSLICIDGR